MSITSTAASGDPNERFTTERAAQIRAAQDRQANLDRRIAAGTLVPLGAGRYRVNDPDSWDNGEILCQRDGQILPEHGLDTTTGRAALYSTVPAWHGLGSVVPGGTTDIDTVLTLGGIDFEVTRRPVLYQPTPDGPARALADQFVTVREDTGAGLGVVGARYEVLPNRAVFAFLQDLVDDHDVVWESAGALREGRKVFVSMRLPDTVTIDAAGVRDEIVPFIVAVNSHDGSSQAHVAVTPWRPVCGNTERFALRDAYTRWGVRHTRNARDRVAEARRTLGLSITYYQRFAAEEQALARTELAIAEFRQVIDELWAAPADDTPQRARTNHQRRVQTLTGLYRSNADRLGATAYAAERAITEYTDWRAAIRPTGTLRGNNLAARATAVIEGSSDELKSKAHRRLLTLTHR
jgi:phage/plasmid-like protein (TIGR03299 family)